jgi:hypothetical protein
MKSWCDAVAGAFVNAPQLALALVALERRVAAVVLKAVFAEMDHWLRGNLFWVWCEVPRLHAVLAKLDGLNVLHPRHNVIMPAATVRHATPASRFLRVLLFAL